MLALYKNGPTSFEDLRTVDGKIHDTFTSAAVAMNLLESDAIFIRSMEDACVQESNLKRLQAYFAMLVFHSKPSDPQALFDRFLDDMFPTPSVNDSEAQPLSVQFRRSEVMKTLEYHFNCMGTSCR